MIRRPPRSTRTDTLFPYTTLFRSTPLPIIAGIFVATIVNHAMAAELGILIANWLTPQILNWILGASFVAAGRSEEHTSELQSLMRISYAVFCLKKKKKQLHILNINTEIQRVSEQQINTQDNN